MIPRHSQPVDLFQLYAQYSNITSSLPILFMPRCPGSASESFSCSSCAGFAGAALAAAPSPCLLTTRPPRSGQHAPFQPFSSPVANEADPKQGVIVFAGDRAGSAGLGNTFLASSPGSEVREGSQLRNPWQKCLCQNSVALLGPAAAENAGGVCLWECTGMENRHPGHGKASCDSFASSTSPGAPVAAGATALLEKWG